MGNKKRAMNRNQEKTTPQKPVTWADCEPTPTQLQNMEKAVLRYMLIKGCGAKELNKSSRQCCEILGCLKDISPDWQSVTHRTFARDEHVQHQALYDVIVKLVKTPPTKDAIEVERKDLRILAAHKNMELPQYELLPEEREQQSEAGRSSEVVSATGKAKKPKSIVATPPQPQKDEDRDAHNQLLGKRSLSSIYDYKDALPFDADESDKKGMKLWRAW